MLLLQLLLFVSLELSSMIIRPCLLSMRSIKFIFIWLLDLIVLPVRLSCGCDNGVAMVIFYVFMLCLC